MESTQITDHEDLLSVTHIISSASTCATCLQSLLSPKNPHGLVVVKGSSSEGPKQHFTCLLSEQTQITTIGNSERHDSDVTHIISSEDRCGICLSSVLDSSDDLGIHIVLQAREPNHEKLHYSCLSRSYARQIAYGQDPTCPLDRASLLSVPEEEMIATQEEIFEQTSLPSICDIIKDAACVCCMTSRIMAVLVGIICATAQDGRCG